MCLKMWIYLTAIVVLLLSLHLVLNYNETARLLKIIPGEDYKFIVGNALDILVNPVDLFQLGRDLANKYDGIYRFWSCYLSGVNIYNPEDIEIVISTTRHNDKSIIYKFLKPWLREGLLLSAGSKWQQRRKILTPAFHFNILRQFSVILEENSKRLVDSLQNKTGEAINVVPIVCEFTIHSICETAMGTQLSAVTNKSEDDKTYKEAILGLGRLLVQRFSRIHLYSEFIFILSSLGKIQKHYLDIVHNFTQNVIKSKKQIIEKKGNIFDENENEDLDDTFNVYKKKRTALLDLLIKAENDGLIDNVGIQEEVDTFMFEGHDTTSSGLTYFFMLLACHKNAQDAIIKELEDIFGDSTRPANIEDLTRMRYLECCIKESLRLYPPVPFISRQLNETIKLSNYTVPAGTPCHVHIYDLHRRADLFKDPLVFDPDRFTPENCIARHPYAYIPFSAGPRNCIGQKFAMMEMKLVTAAVLREYELLPVTKPEDLVFTADLVLRSKDPVFVKFVKRY